MDTSQNLLRRIKTSFHSEEWNRFVRIYTPLISRWLTRFGIADADVPDLTQEVLHAAATDVTRFEHNGRQGAFRNWLRTIALNRCRRHWRKQSRQPGSQKWESVAEQLDELADPLSELSRKWDQEHDSYVLRGLFEAMEREFDLEALQVFDELVLQEQAPSQVAQNHGWTVGKVYKTKFRIMQRLRQNGRRFLD